MKNITLRVQFVGYGNMWSSLGKIVKTKSHELQLHLDMGIERKSSSINFVGYNADIVFACVKPVQFKDISLDRYNRDAVCVSIMNGITTDKLAYFSNIIRTMPNLLGEVGEWITGWHEKWSINPDLKNFMQSVFTESGIVVVLDREIDFSAFTAFAWCWPAIASYIEQYAEDEIYRSFVYDCLREVGVMLWFSVEQSSIMVEKIRYGLPKYLNKYSITHADMIQRVSAWDKASSTYHIIDSFAKNKFDALLLSQDIAIKEVLYTGIWTGKLQSDKITELYSK